MLSRLKASRLRMPPELLRPFRLWQMQQGPGLPQPWGPDDPFIDLIREQAALMKRVARTETKETPIYQKATYSPTYTGSATAGATTYSIQDGFYWRIGSVVLVTGTVVWTAATGTGNAQVSLPFTPNINFGFRASGGLRVTTVTFTTTTPEIIVSASSALFTMESPVSNAVGNIVQMEAAGNITFSVFYGV